MRSFYPLRRPRLHLIRFHGVLAPNAGLCAEIVPGPPQNVSVPADEHAPGAPARMGWARLLRMAALHGSLRGRVRCAQARVAAAAAPASSLNRRATHTALAARQFPARTAFHLSLPPSMLPSMALPDTRPA